MSREFETTENNVLARFRSIALVIGAIGAIATVIGAFTATDQFFQSYLIGFVLLVMVSVGALGLTLIHNMTGGVWGAMIRRTLEAAYRTIPIVGLAAIPVFLGMERIFLWARPGIMEQDHLLHRKAAYLNEPFFVGRTIGYFLIWSAIVVLLEVWGRSFTRDGSFEAGVKARRLSAVGLLILGFTLTFASVDWLMSLDPHWYSTMFGIWFVVCCLLTAMAFAIVMVTAFGQRETVVVDAGPTRLRDLANLLFAFVMLWAYTGFSQFMLIWYGNIREEVPWYTTRAFGEWGSVAIALVLFHFFVPFGLLLIRKIKDRAKTLGIIATLILAMRFVDMIWTVNPVFSHEHFAIHWLDFAALAALAGLWLFVFLTFYRREPLIASVDPYEPEVAVHG